MILQPVVPINNSIINDPYAVASSVNPQYVSAHYDQQPIPNPIYHCQNVNPPTAYNPNYHTDSTNSVGTGTGTGTGAVYTCIPTGHYDHDV